MRPSAKADGGGPHPPQQAILERHRPRETETDGMQGRHLYATIATATSALIGILAAYLGLGFAALLGITIVGHLWYGLWLNHKARKGAKVSVIFWDW